LNQEVHGAETARVIVALIRQGDQRGEEMLYSVLSRGMKFMAIRKLGPEDGLDCFHDTMLVLIRRIREGALQEAAALFGYARTILVREIAEQLEKRRRVSMVDDFDAVSFAIADPQASPEAALEAGQRVTTMRRCLLALRPKEREILTRFYLQEQSAETIQQEMNLTATQFRLLKSRSKQKLEQITAGTEQTVEIVPPAAAAAWSGEAPLRAASAHAR
jgi:RNA polymerase sigma factor (sigma-70 family)